LNGNVEAGCIMYNLNFSPFSLVRTGPDTNHLLQQQCYVCVGGICFYLRPPRVRSAACRYVCTERSSRSHMLPILSEIGRWAVRIGRLVGRKKDSECLSTMDTLIISIKINWYKKHKIHIIWLYVKRKLKNFRLICYTYQKIGGLSGWKELLINFWNVVITLLQYFFIKLYKHLTN
jgi:hypothetical protein